MAKGNSFHTDLELWSRPQPRVAAEQVEAAIERRVVVATLGVVNRMLQHPVALPGCSRIPLPNQNGDLGLKQMVSYVSDLLNGLS